MELIFQAGELDEFYENENGTALSTAMATAGVMDGCIAAMQLAEWHNVGTTSLPEPQCRSRLMAFYCCGIILEAVLLDDEKRRALAKIHNSCVRIGSHPASSYHEAIYNLVRVRIIHVECENGRGARFPKYGKAPKHFSDLRHTSFRVFNGFPGGGYPIGWIVEVGGELQREADIAGSLVPTLTSNEERMQFCFNEWQAGKTLKEINTALKQRGWEPFESALSVRGPRDAWGKRIGLEPRKGQSGRKPKSAQRKRQVTRKHR